MWKTDKRGAIARVAGGHLPFLPENGVSSRVTNHLVGLGLMRYKIFRAQARNIPGKPTMTSFHRKMGPGIGKEKLGLCDLI